MVGKGDPQPALGLVFKSSWTASPPSDWVGPWSISKRMNIVKFALWKYKTTSPTSKGFVVVGNGDPQAVHGLVLNSSWKPSPPNDLAGPSSPEVLRFKWLGGTRRAAKIWASCSSRRVWKYFHSAAAPYLLWRKHSTHSSPSTYTVFAKGKKVRFTFWEHRVFKQ